MKKYYSIEFEYEGHSRFRVFSRDFLLSEGATYQEIREKTEELFMGWVESAFPTEIAVTFHIPEHLTIIEGGCWS